MRGRLTQESLGGPFGTFESTVEQENPPGVTARGAVEIPPTPNLNRVLLGP